MNARIFKPARNAMQSGQAKDDWVLEYAPEEPGRIDPLMGWTGSGDTASQIRLTFHSRDAAIAYAQKHKLPYRVEEEKRRAQVLRPKGYGSNFAYERKGAWTH